MTFALAYFGMDGLPDDLEEIPVETVGIVIAYQSRNSGGLSSSPM